VSEHFHPQPATHQARFGLAARANGGRSFHGAVRPSGSFTSPLPSHRALSPSRAQRTSSLQCAAEVDIRPRPQEDLQSRVWVVAFGSGASTGFPCSRRRDGCQGRTSLRSLNQSQAPGRESGRKRLQRTKYRDTQLLRRCHLPVSSVNSARRAARGRFSTIVENRRALYQEGARSSRLPSVRVDQKASSLRVVGALAFCSLRGQRSPDPLGSLQALAIPRGDDDLHARSPHNRSAVRSRLRPRAIGRPYIAHKLRLGCA